MVFTTGAFAFTAPIASLLLSITVTVLPLGDEDGFVDVSTFGLHRRQDPGLCQIDPLGTQPEHEGDTEIAAISSRPLRSGIKRRENWILVGNRRRAPGLGLAKMLALTFS